MEASDLDGDMGRRLKHLPWMPGVGVSVAFLAWPSFFYAIVLSFAHPSHDTYESTIWDASIAPFLIALGFLCLCASSWISGFILQYSRRISVSIATVNLVLVVLIAWFFIPAVFYASLLLCRPPTLFGFLSTRVRNRT